VGADALETHDAAIEQAQAASRHAFAKIKEQDLKERSVADHQRLFRRVDLPLSPAPVF
jgi:hypothetical protein